MNRNCSLCIAIMVFVSSICAPAQTATLPRGARIRLTMPYPVSLSAAEVGDMVQWKVAEDVTVQGITVIAKGANATGVVSSVFGAGSQPRLTMQMETAELLSGASVPLCVQQDGYRLLHFYTTPGNDAVVPNGAKVTVMACSTVAVVAGSPTVTLPQAQGKDPRSAFTLPDGTPVHLKFARAVSSAEARPGDRVAFVVAESVRVDGVLALAAESTAWGTVTQARTSGEFGRRGHLEVTLDYVRLVSGEQAALRANKIAEGRTKKLETWGPLVFWGVGGLVIAGTEEGHDVVIPKGKDLTAYVNGDLRFGATRGLTSPSATPKLSLAAADLLMTSVNVQSTPLGAEILLDGKFVGNTPATILVNAGEHVIRLSKRGFRPWSRKLTSSGGSVSLSAHLARVSPGAKPTHKNSSLVPASE